MNETKELKILNLLLFFIILPIISLSQTTELHRDDAQKFPVIVDMLPKANQKSTRYTTSVSEARFVYTGKYDDTIQLNSDTKPYYNFSYKSYRDSLGEIRFYKDSLLNKSGLEILVDPLQHLSLDQAPFRATVYIASEGFTVDSIQTKKNLEEWLKQPRQLIEAIPVFIANNTNDTVYLDHQDLNAFIIQEAMDEDGKWKPIEYWQYSKCGNSYHETAIRPYHLIVVKITRYNGNFKTWLRVKFLNGGKVFYSNTFEGSVNKEQLSPGIWTNKNLSDPYFNSAKE